MTWALSLVLDAAEGLRENALPYMLSNFDDPARLVGNRQELEAYIGETVGGVGNLPVPAAWVRRATEWPSRTPAARCGERKDFKFATPR